MSLINIFLKILVVYIIIRHCCYLYSEKLIIVNYNLFKSFHRKIRRTNILPLKKIEILEKNFVKNLYLDCFRSLDYFEFGFKINKPDSFPFFKNFRHPEVNPLEILYHQIEDDLFSEFYELWNIFLRNPHKWHDFENELIQYEDFLDLVDYQIDLFLFATEYWVVVIDIHFEPDLNKPFFKTNSCFSEDSLPALFFIAEDFYLPSFWFKGGAKLYIHDFFSSAYFFKQHKDYFKLRSNLWKTFMIGRRPFCHTFRVIKINNNLKKKIFKFKKKMLRITKQERFIIKRYFVRSNYQKKF